MIFLIYGANGWIGSKIVKILKDMEHVVIFARSRLENFEAIRNEITTISPDRVILAAGLTGRPNVDWCEDHKMDVLKVNVIGTSLLAEICHENNVHLSYFGTGCIYSYDLDHTMTGEKGFTEDDNPNFEGSYYSKTKIITEKILKEFGNVLILRIRMPLSDDLHPRNFITKITKYEKVVNIPNSMTVLHEMLPIATDMCIKAKTGIYNFTNPGVISHNEILDLYKKYIDPSFTYQNFTLQEQAKILKAQRSNNCLDVSKLKSEYPELEDIHLAIIHLFERMSKNV